MGMDAGCDLHHLGGCRHLEIERHEKLALQALHILIPDMPPVLSQMGRDAVCPGQNGHVSGPDGIRMDAAPGIPHGRDMVDVDAKAKGKSSHALFLAKERATVT